MNRVTLYCSIQLMGDSIRSRIPDRIHVKQKSA